MFPLGTVLLPGAILPLHVFEPRYRMMVRAALAGSGEFGVVLIERGHEVGGGDARFATGCRARIARAQELPDGRFALTAVGLEVIDVVEWLPDDPYPRARVRSRRERSDVPDPPGTPGVPALGAARARLHARLAELARLLGAPDAFDPLLPVGDDAAAWAVAASLRLGPLDLQQLLELFRLGERLERLADLVDDRIAVLRGGRADGA